jgi:hypothetical protein
MEHVFALYIMYLRGMFQCSNVLKVNAKDKVVFEVCRKAANAKIAFHN